MLRVDERQRDERPAVLRPGRHRREPIEPDVAGDDFGDRPARAALQADLQQLEADVARAPDLGRRRRQQRLGQVHEPLDQPKRPLAEGELGAARRAEQVRDERKVRARDVAEDQRRPAGGDHAAMDLGGFEIRIDRRVDLDDVVVAAKARRGTRGDREHSCPGTVTESTISSCTSCIWSAARTERCTLATRATRSAREKIHNRGRGARYTSGRRPVRLVYSETFESRSDALKREHQLKRLTRVGKEALIATRRTRRARRPR